MELACFHFCNTYLSGIQTGIQSAYAQMEMFNMYKQGDTPTGILYEWAENHKTMICLNGGDSDNLDEIYALLLKDLILNKSNYPFAKFKEPGINNSTTNVCIVFPCGEDLDRMVCKTDSEKKIKELIQNSNLAR